MSDVVEDEPENNCESDFSTCLSAITRLEEQQNRIEGEIASLRDFVVSLLDRKEEYFDKRSYENTKEKSMVDDVKNNFSW